MNQNIVDFMIVGSMKSGTTLMYEDLLNCEKIFFPANKEPMSFTCDSILTDKGWRDYKRLFNNASGQLKGEASTTYTMLPEFDGVVDRVRKRLSCSIKVIYLIRDPITRIESHINHDYLAGRIIDLANFEFDINSKYLKVTEYYKQIKPWIDYVGVENVYITTYENYTRNRLEEVQKVLQFLDVGIDRLILDENRRSNPTQGRLVPSGFIKRYITDNNYYKNYVKPLVPRFVKEVLARLLQKKVTFTKYTLSEVDKDKIVQALSIDYRNLMSLTDKDFSEWSSFRRYYDD
jgi:hypothetical protein